MQDVGHGVADPAEPGPEVGYVEEVQEELGVALSYQLCSPIVDVAFLVWRQRLEGTRWCGSISHHRDDGGLTTTALRGPASGRGIETPFQAALLKVPLSNPLVAVRLAVSSSYTSNCIACWFWTYQLCCGTLCCTLKAYLPETKGDGT